MKLKISDIQDPELRRVVFALQTVLSNVSSDNFNLEELTGTTDPIADTQLLLRHNLKEIPKLWFILEGDIYIPRYGISRTTIDVRSRFTSNEFRMLLVS
jgi:hypothetical protein